MIPGQTISVQLAKRDTSPLPIPNVLVLINLFVAGKYRYGFVAGRTDERGRLNISYDHIEQLRQLSSQEFLMDYNTKLEECDPLVQVVVPSEQDLLARKQKVLENFGKLPDWAATWPENAKVKPGETTTKLIEQTAEILLPAE